MKTANARLLTTQTAQLLIEAERYARSINHEYIGTEHLLLALAANDNDAAHVLQSVGIFADQIREKIESLVLRGPAPVVLNHIPLTPRAKAAIQYAIDHAQSVAQPLVEPGHLLLGVLHEPAGVASRVLRDLGLNLPALEQQVLRIRLLQMKMVERIVRPLRASVSHKRKLREELLAHLTAIYEEEIQIRKSPAALDAAAIRFGDPDSLAREFQRDVPLFQRLSFHFNRFLGWRAPESATRYMLRIAGIMLAFNVLCSVMLLLIIASKAGLTTDTLNAVLPIAAFLGMLSMDCFLLGTLYYQTRDTLLGAFGAPKSDGKLFILLALFFLVLVASHQAMLFLTSGPSALKPTSFFTGCLGALAATLFDLYLAKTTGPIEIRDTIWACLDLETAD